MTAIQDEMVNNFCWGCGADNPAGLRLKSVWDDGVVVGQWVPSPNFAAGPRHVLNGGIIATLLDCHGVCTAIDDAYRREGHAVGTDPEIWYATASLSVEYLRPTPIDEVVDLAARVVETSDRKTAVDCMLMVGGKERARAVVHAVRVPEEWRHGMTN